MEGSTRNNWSDGRSISSSTTAVVIIVIVLVAAGVSVAILYAPGSTSSSVSSVSSTSYQPTTSVQTSSAPVPTSTSTTATPSKVTLMLDFAPTGYHAMFYYGLDHGIYAKNGIDLTILPGSGSANTIAAVATGKVEFGFADTGTLVVAATKSNVTNVRMVAVPFQRTPYAIIFNKASISKPSDLNGKTMSSFTGSGPLALFQIFAQKNNINASSIHTVYMSPAQSNPVVALGKVDFTPTTVNQVAEIQPVATANGIQLGFFPYAQYGLDIYGASILTSTSMLNSHPDTVRQFVAATMQSILAAAKSPKDAVPSLLKYNAQLNSSLALGDFQMIVSYSLAPNINSTSNALSLGSIDAQKMKTTVGVIVQGFGITNPPEPASLYTDRFLQSG